MPFYPFDEAKEKGDVNVQEREQIALLYTPLTIGGESLLLALNLEFPIRPKIVAHTVSIEANTLRYASLSRRAPVLLSSVCISGAALRCRPP